MLKSVRGVFAATLLAGSALAATPALAEDGDSEFTISGNAAVVSEYRFRGVGLSDGDVAIQGGIDLAHKSGFYIGTWGSSLANTDSSVQLQNMAGVVGSYDVGNYGAVELDVYAGWSGDLGGGFSGDIGVLYYLYPNATNRNALWMAPPAANQFPVFAGYEKFPTDYYEFYASVGYTFGPVESTFGVAYAPDQKSLGSTDNLYLYLDLSAGIPNTPVTLNAHAGYTDGFLTFTNNSKAWDWSIGADVALNENLSIGIAYMDVEESGPDIRRVTDDRLVGTLSVSF